MHGIWLNELEIHIWCEQETKTVLRKKMSIEPKTIEKNGKCVT